MGEGNNEMNVGVMSNECGVDMIKLSSVVLSREAKRRCGDRGERMEVVDVRI
jgi:hypothetical protein